MKKRILFFLILFLCLFSFPAAAEKEKKRVFYLNSYQNGYAWSDNILEGIRSVFDRSDCLIDLQIEYMDTKRYYNEAIEKNLFEYYGTKFQTDAFDVIVTSDNNAFDFILKYQDSLFPGVPVVFCGLNDFKPESIAGRPVTGIVETIAVRDTLEIALKLHPDRKRVIFVGDQSATGRAITRQTKKALENMDASLAVEYWTTDSYSDVLKKIKRLQSDTILFYLPIYSYRDGGILAARETLARFYEIANVPIYSNWVFFAGYGIVGGKLTSGKYHGEIAAGMALRVISGESASDIPVVTENEFFNVFDYNVMKKFGISPAKLPPESIMINRPHSFYKLNRKVFWTIMVFLFVLCATLVLLVLNIRKRKYVEGKINDQLSFLKTLMDTVPVPIYFKDVRGVFQGCNIAFEKWFGVKRREIIGEDDSLISCPYLKNSLFDDADRRLLEKKGVDVYESILCGEDGSEHHVILNKATYVNARGEIVGLVGAIYDIDDIKKAKDELHRTKEEYRSIFENASKGIFIIDAEGRPIKINQAFAEILGFDSKEDAMTGLVRLKPFFAAPEQSAELWDVLRSGEEISGIEIEFYTMKGDRRWASVNATPVFDNTGKLVHVEGIGEDITQRKEAEIAVIESRRKLMLVLDNIPQLVYWQDHDFRYVGVNQSFLDFFNLGNPQNVIGKTDYELFGDSEKTRISAELDQEVIDTNQPCYGIRVNVTLPDRKEKVCLEFNKIPLHDDKGAVVGILSTAEDITQKMNLEKQLLQSQKMEALGRLSGGIAHDFNNILTSIINSTELALEDIPEKTVVHEDLTRVLKASGRGSQLVRQILAFSRPSREEFNQVNIVDVIREALGLISSSLPGNIGLFTHIAFDEGLCLANPVQIHQVVMNLCTNSLQALTGSGGSISVSLEKENIGEDRAEILNVEPGDFFKLTVSDNGPGIPAEIIDKIFDPFFTTKEKGVGTGLGLAVVHGIIKSHNGAIEAVSVPGEKTMISIYLPVAVSGKEFVNDTVADLPRGTERILFVEDDPDQRKTVPRILTKLGYQVAVRPDAARALEVIYEDPASVDLLVTDFDMPDINGFELAEQLESVTSEIPVIIVSGRGKAASLEKTHNIRKIIMKPYNKRILSEAVREVLDGDRQRMERKW